MGTRSTTEHRIAATGTSRATIEDVARAAGVSVATVSRALRGLPNVAISTRDRVTQVAEELDYRADPAASRLAAGRSQAVGVVVPVLEAWYFSHVVAGVEAVCSEAGYDLVVIGATGDESRRALVHSSASLVRRVDGLIFVEFALRPDELAAIDRHQVPVVVVGSHVGDHASVGIDDVRVGDLATSHLVELGHRRIGVIGGQAEDPLRFDVPELRLAGHVAALERVGLEHDPSLHVTGNFSVAGGHEAMLHLLRRADPPTAVFAMSDEMAFGALQALREQGIRVPDDISIVGVDDHDVSVVLGLTTVRQDVPGHGSLAARLLIDELRGRKVATGTHRTAVRLVGRETTAPPR